MKQITWNAKKAEVLREDSTRNNVGFEDCLVAIEEGRVLDDIPHPFLEHQRLFILEIAAYAYVVPYVESEEEIFLKTLYPSRRQTAIYLKDLKS
jgi:hypothetical protein